MDTGALTRETCSGCWNASHHKRMLAMNESQFLICLLGPIFPWVLLLPSPWFFLTVNPQGAPSNPSHHIQRFTTYSPTKCQSSAPSSFLRLTVLDLCACRAALEISTNRGRTSFVRQPITYNEPQAGADEARDQLHKQCERGIPSGYGGMSWKTI